jgi:hypothetical protein
VVGGIYLTDGSELKCLTGVDDHSRFCVSAGLMHRANSKSVCDHFLASLDRYGIPQEILTDNGKVFTGRSGYKDTEVLFEKDLQGEWDRTSSGCPTLSHHHGKNRTLSSEPAHLVSYGAQV